MCPTFSNIKNSCYIIRHTRVKIQGWATFLYVSLSRTPLSKLIWLHNDTKGSQNRLSVSEFIGKDTKHVLLCPTNEIIPKLYLKFASSEKQNLCLNLYIYISTTWYKINETFYLRKMINLFLYCYLYKIFNSMEIKFGSSS